MYSSLAAERPLASAPFFQFIMSTEKPVVERLSKGRTVCTVTVSEQEFAPAEADALQRFSQNVSIKGFRPGHAPLDLVRERVGADQLFEESIRLVLRRILPALAEENNLVPVVPPKVEVESKLPVKLKITFIERPQVTVKNSAKIAVPKKEVKAETKDIERVIESVLQEHRTAKVVERAAKKDDQVKMDFTAKDEDGNDIPELTATNYDAVIGSKTLLPGFEDELEGMKAGDTKTFTLTLPEKFQMEKYRGKKASFTVKVHTVEELTMPTLDDAFAKEKLQSESAAAFREMVETSVRQQEEQFDRMGRERELMDLIRKNTTVEIADELVDEEVRGMINDWAQRLEAQGKTIAEVLEETKKTPEETEKEMRAQAEDRWKLRLGIAKLIEERKIETTPEMLEASFATFLGNVPPEQQAEAKAEWDKRGNMYEEIRWRSMVDTLVDQLLA